MSIRVRFLPIFCGGKFSTNARKGLAIIVRMHAKIVHETFLQENERKIGAFDELTSRRVDKGKVNKLTCPLVY